MIDYNGDQLGIMKTNVAFQRAKDYGLDLVEISPTAKPPLCKIMDYGKFKYEQEKKRKEQKKNQVQTKLKEVKFRVNVDEHDYKTKLRNLRKFIDNGDRVKVSLMFRGRKMRIHNLDLRSSIELFKRPLTSQPWIKLPDNKEGL